MKSEKDLRGINLKLCCLILTVVFAVLATVNMYFIRGLNDFSTSAETTLDVAVLNALALLFFALTLFREEDLQRYARFIFRGKKKI